MTQVMPVLSRLGRVLAVVFCAALRPDTPSARTGDAISSSILQDWSHPLLVPSSSVKGYYSLSFLFLHVQQTRNRMHKHPTGRVVSLHGNLII